MMQVKDWVNPGGSEAGMVFSLVPAVRIKAGSPMMPTIMYTHAVYKDTNEQF